MRVIRMPHDGGAWVATRVNRMAPPVGATGLLHKLPESFVVSLAMRSRFSSQASLRLHRLAHDAQVVAAHDLGDLLLVEAPARKPLDDHPQMDLVG